MMSISSNNQYLKMIIVSVAVSFFSTVFRSNMVMSYILCGIEITVLLILLLKGAISKYVCYYSLFICNCMEFETFAEGINFYNLKSIRLFGLNLAMWLLILLAIVLILKHPKFIVSIKKEGYEFYRFGYGLLLLNIVAMMVGLISIMLNENGINAIDGIGRSFVGEIYYAFLIPFCIFIAFVYIREYEENDMKNIMYALYAVLIGTVFQLVFALLFGIYGTYGNNITLYASNLVMFIPFLLLSILYEVDGINAKAIFIVGIIGTLIAASFNAGGKFLLNIIIVFVYLTWKMMWKKGISVTKILYLLFVAAVCISLPFVIVKLTENSKFNFKYHQVLSLIRFWDKGWFDSIMASPKVRIMEITESVSELIHKPWYLFTGKGYLGSFKDHYGFFSNNYFYGAYSDAEWANGIFYNLHEIASFLITYGLLGILYIAKVIRFVGRNAKQNFWCLIAIYWIVLLYGYSFTISVFGIVVMLFCFCYQDNIGFIQNNIRQRGLNRWN